LYQRLLCVRYFWDALDCRLHATCVSCIYQSQVRPCLAVTIGHHGDSKVLVAHIESTNNADEVLLDQTEVGDGLANHKSDVHVFQQVLSVGSAVRWSS
jgi:hypothetical protein